MRNVASLLASRLIPFTIAYLEELITKYGKTYKRRTKLTEAEAIDVRELTAEELPIVYDKERGFLGSEVKGEAAFRCSPLDRLMLVWENGRYQMIPPPERVFVDKDLLYFGIYDRDRIFTVVYSTSKATFLKRFAFGEDDLRTLFVTASTSLYRLRVVVPGLRVF